MAMIQKVKDFFSSFRVCFVFDTKLIKIKTDPKRGEKVFKEAIKILQGKEPKVSKECGFCKLRREIIK